MGGIATSIITALGLALIPAVQAIPADAWESLGPWGTPVSLAVGGGVATLAAYLRHDPAREPTVVTETPIAAPPVGGSTATDSMVLTEDQVITEDAG